MIIASAIKYKGVIYPGKRHHNCIATIHDIFGNAKDIENVQGFIDENGNFYDRGRALKIAIQCGQMKVLKDETGLLYSEDIF